MSIKPLSDKKPSTGRRKMRLVSKKNRRRIATPSSIKKLVYDTAMRSYIRTFELKYPQTVIQWTPVKVSSPKGDVKRLLNKRKGIIEKCKNKNLHRFSSTLKEGETHSDVDKSPASITTGILKEDYCDDGDDDCMLIEPVLEEITIDDNDDDDDDHDDFVPSTSRAFNNYESLIHSLNEYVSSTPCHNRKTPSSYGVVEHTGDKHKADELVPFFVDVAPSCNTESNKPTKNVAHYIKLSTLTENPQPKCASMSFLQTCNNTDIIDIGDNSSDSTDSTLKCKSENMCDDSVVFVSETNKNDFIPIVDDIILPNKILKRRKSKNKSPVNRLRTNNLFTQSETKKINEYNENAYNPCTTEALTSGKRMVIIDGSNVAFKHGLDQAFSVKGLKIVIEYFEKLGHEVKAVIPQFRMNKSKSTNHEELERLHKAGKIVPTPCKNIAGHTSTSYDDRFILQLALVTDAAVISNDNYRDLLHENPAFTKIIENRVIGYTWCNDIFILPKDPYGKWGPTLHTILNRS